MDLFTEEEIPRTIEVSGLPENIDQDDVFGYYENPRFGGGKIEKLKMRETPEGVTFITFTDESVVDSLLSRQLEKKARIGGLSVDIKRCEKPSPVPVIGREVVVSGIPSDWEEMDILELLENKRKGGGPVEGIAPGDTSGASIVTFVDQKVAENLVEKGEIGRSGVSLEISWPMRLGKAERPVEEVICPKTILVEDVPEEHMELLWLALENKRRNGGGKLETVDRKADGRVLATFEEEEAASRVLKRGTVSLNGKKYSITKPSSGGKASVPDFPNTIEVSGIPETTSEEFLKMYFENTKRSGGGDIETLNYNREDGVATITFKDSEAVEGILKKNVHTLGSDNIRIIALESLTPDLIDQVCAIRVTNIPPDVSRDLLECYFESEKRSGGDEFDEFIHDKDDGSLIIVFRSPEVCRRVTNRPHQLSSVQLTVEALKPAPPPPIVVGETDKKKLLFGDLPPDFKDDELKEFLEKEAGCQIIQFIHGSVQDVVLADFKGVPNYLALRKLLVSRPFQGQMISVQKVKPNASVLVHGAKSLSDDQVTLYFENSKRGGGGEVKTTRRDHNNDVIIEFSDPSVIPKVLKKPHEFEKHKLKVEIYHEGLYQATGNISRKSKARIPEEFMVSVDEEILEFIATSDTLKAKIESEMENLHCEIQWQSPKDGSIKLRCTLVPGTKDFVKLSAKWGSSCSELINTQLGKVVLKEENISEEIWNEFAKAVEGMKQKGVRAKPDQSRCSLRVVGTDDAVGSYLKKVGETRNKLQAELAKRKCKTYKSMKTLKQFQLQLLKILKFPKKEHGISKDLVVNVDNQEVSFQGTEEEVSQAMIVVYELANNMQTRDCPNFDRRRTKLLQKKQTIDFFMELFESKNLAVYWNISAKGLEVYGMTDNQIRDALSLMDSEIECKEITLEVSQIPTVKQRKWSDFIKGIEDLLKVVDIATDTSRSVVTVTSTRTSIDQIVAEVGCFLDEHTILEKFIPMEVGQVSYINQFMSDKMKDLQQELNKEGTIIELMEKKKSAGVLVRGTKTGIEIATKGYIELQQQILCTTHETDIYGVSKYFSAQRGKEAIEKIQNAKKVIVEVGRQPKNARNSENNGGHQNSKVPILKSSVDLQGSAIKVFKGNLTECQVKALVIPIGDELKHTDGVSKVILEAGGQKIEEECQTFVKTKGKLLPGQIFVSKSGTLPFAGIIHVAVPPVKGDDKEKEANYLYEGIWTALKKAKQQKWTSIAIAGGSGLEASIATKTIVDSVDEFLKSNTDSRMDIILIDSTDQVVNHFLEILVQKYGKGSVILPTPATGVSTGNTKSQHIQSNYKQGKDASTVLTPEGLQVSIIQGTIATEQVDVIVNTVSNDLNLTQGEVSKSILQAAGPNIQVECKSKSPSGLTAGQMLVTSGYSLKCKNVYHTVCRAWDGGSGKAEKIIRDLLKKSFETCHQAKMSSIAVPALGTGNLGTPKDIASAIMYEEAEIFSKSQPNTTLKDIRFVVFDQPTVDAFQKHVMKLSNPSAAPSNEPKKTAKSRRLKDTWEILSPEAEAVQTIKRREEWKQTDDIAPDDDIALDVPLKTIKIKSVVMEIKQGDITDENTDAIVNSTNSDLNLSGGAVTKAILKAGGQSIADECKKLGKTDKHGVAVTGSGKLKCRCIIHLATPDNSLGKMPEGKAWEERISNCLKEAEKIKLTSIAMPVLGTGKWNTPSGEMAIYILNAVGKFALTQSPKHLKTIRISIFQPSMVDEFFTAITKKLSEKKSSGSLWGQLKGWMSSLMTSDSSTGDSDFQMLEQPQESQLDLQSFFRIYGLSQGIIDEVIVKLENLVKEAVSDKVLDDPVDQESIAKLTAEQVKMLEADAASHQVKVTVEQGQKINRIRLQGDASDITDVVLNITKILREVEKQEIKKRAAKQISEQAHWEYENDDGYDSYPAEINAIIETAFRNKLGFAKWEENDGEFKVDFKTNTEEELQTTKTIKVRRIGDAPIEEPKNWETMNPGETCRLVPVPVGSKEYDEVETRIKATCQQTCKEIMKIERVQNPSFYQQYAVKKLHMEAAAGAGTTVERILWHGTSAETVQQINVHGFNRSYCGKNATAYGEGVYFARDWSYSAHATYSPPNPPQGFKSIYQVRVLTGEFALGNPAYRDAPLKLNQKVERYDSVVDNISNPGIFVVFRDAQAYPEYLITFI